ncbi:MAG: SH3 domain-containing protein [Candidatus Marinimicrobia bacterium]|nr:SH3 domain-containing protein [Candidatus Neomarinimicrobiota bacterium]
MKICLLLIVALFQVGFSQTLNVKENIRNVPNGKIIGQIESGTKIQVIHKKGNWAKVCITGYIWVPSIKSEFSGDMSEFNAIVGNALHAVTRFNDRYHKLVKNELKNPNFSKYAKLDFMIWAYMQSIWDKYEGLYGISGAEEKVFNNTANKFKISKSEAIKIFNRVDNAIY